jgi:hypothetical protein
MTLISYTKINDGETIDAADVNTPLDTIYDDYNGNIDSNNLKASAVTNAKIADGAVNNAKLDTTAGDIGGEWKSWTPTWTNLSVGNGTIVSRYTVIGKTVHYSIRLIFGSTTSISGSVSFTPPVNIDSSAVIYNGSTYFNDSGTGDILGASIVISTTNIRVYAVQADDTYAKYRSLNSTIPFTWTTNDRIDTSGTYEAA